MLSVYTPTVACVEILNSIYLWPDLRKIRLQENHHIGGDVSRTHCKEVGTQVSYSTFSQCVLETKNHNWSDGATESQLLKQVSQLCHRLSVRLPWNDMHCRSLVFTACARLTKRNQRGPLMNLVGLKSHMLSEAGLRLLQ